MITVIDIAPELAETNYPAHEQRVKMLRAAYNPATYIIATQYGETFYITRGEYGAEATIGYPAKSISFKWIIGILNKSMTEVQVIDIKTDDLSLDYVPLGAER